MKPHKWAKEIKAWADGAEIEFKDPILGWGSVTDPTWYEYNEYRIKPQPKEPQYLYAYFVDSEIKLVKGGQLVETKSASPTIIYIGKIKLETEDE